MTYVRTQLAEFDLANPIYRGARVFAYGVSGGAKTAALIPLYSDELGVGQEGNPQVLDARGQFKQPVFFDEPTILVIDGVLTPDHDTGVVNPALNDADVVAATAAAASASASAVSAAASAAALTRPIPIAEGGTASVTPLAARLALGVQHFQTLTYAGAALTNADRGGFVYVDCTAHSTVVLPDPTVVEDGFFIDVLFESRNAAGPVVVTTTGSRNIRQRGASTSSFKSPGGGEIIRFVERGGLFQAMQLGAGQDFFIQRQSTSAAGFITTTAAWAQWPHDASSGETAYVTLNGANNVLAPVAGLYAIYGRMQFRANGGDGDIDVAIGRNVASPDFYLIEDERVLTDGDNTFAYLNGTIGLSAGEEIGLFYYGGPNLELNENNPILRLTYLGR